MPLPSRRATPVGVVQIYVSSGPLGSRYQAGKRFHWGNVGRVKGREQEKAGEASGWPLVRGAEGCGVKEVCEVRKSRTSARRWGVSEPGWLV